MGAWTEGVRNLINLGSTCMYPAAAPNPLSEDMILTGSLEATNEGYALAKIMAMRLCDYINREDPKARFKTLIPCNLFGPHDKFDPKHSHLLPAIIHKVHQAKIEGAPNVEIWGNGKARREFMYAPDLPDAVFQAADLASGGTRKSSKGTSSKGTSRPQQRGLPWIQSHLRGVPARPACRHGMRPSA